MSRLGVVLAALALGGAVVGAIALTRGGNDKQQAEETVRQFVKATNERNGDKFCNDLVTQQFLEQTTGAKGNRARAVCKRQFKSLKGLGLRLVRIEGAEINGDKGKVTTVLDARGQRQRQIFRLKKQGGDWRLTGGAGE